MKLFKNLTFENYLFIIGFSFFTIWLITFNISNFNI